MADARYNPALIQKQWAKDLFADVWADQFFTRFTGSSSNSIIQTNTALKGKGSGDMVRFPIVYQIKGDPVMDCDTLEGQEMTMTEDYMDVYIRLYRQGIRIPCMDFAEHMTWINHRQLAKDQLKNWFADYFDKEMFRKLAAAPTSKRLLDAGTEMTLDTISGLKQYAQLADPKIRPVRVDGGEHYVLVMHPYVSRTLKVSDEWKRVQSVADVRGGSNKLFTGALGMWDGVVLYEHENVPETAVGSGKYSNMFLGAQSGVLAESMDHFWRERDFEDYGQIYKVATGTIRGFEKTKFTLGKGYTPVGTGAIQENPDPTDGDVQDYGILNVTVTASAWTGPTV